MSTHERWVEHMDDGSNPLAGFFVAGWANRQYVRVTDACKQNVDVGEQAKVEMLRDYLQTCFNMHLGLIDTKSLRSKTIYWSHRLMKDVDDTVHHDLVRLLRDEMQLGGENFLGPRCTHQNGRALADGGYAQVSLLHVEAMNILNRDYFHLNDLNLSLLFRMLVTSTHHNIGIHNDKLSSMGSSMVACRGGGHYTGRWSVLGPGMGSAGGGSSSSNIAATYQVRESPTLFLSEPCHSVLFACSPYPTPAGFGQAQQRGWRLGGESPRMVPVVESSQLKHHQRTRLWPGARRPDQVYRGRAAHHRHHPGRRQEHDPV